MLTQVSDGKSKKLQFRTIPIRAVSPKMKKKIDSIYFWQTITEFQEEKSIWDFYCQLKTWKSQEISNFQNLNCLLISFFLLDYTNSDSAFLGIQNVSMNVHWTLLFVLIFDVVTATIV